MAKRKIDTLQLKIDFNDKMMRELKLDLADTEYGDTDYLYDYISDTFLTIKGKFIKYTEEEYPLLKHDEIDLNLIENARLSETISIPFFNYYCTRKGYIFQSISQCPIDGTDKGIFMMHYAYNGETHSVQSDAFKNESVRVFNLICKLNKTEHMYNFNDLDIIIERKR